MNDVNLWKKRYSELLKEFERYKTESLKAEKLALRVCIRLIIAMEGFVPSVDPLLHELLGLIRKEIRNEKIAIKLDEVSDTLVRDAKSTQSVQPYGDPKLLLNFLEFCVDSPEEKATLREFEERLGNNGFTSASGLFDAILKLPIAKPPPENNDSATSSGFLRKLLFWTIAKPQTDSSGTLDVVSVRNRVALLLRALDIPLQLRGQTQQLLTRLTQTQSPKELLAILDETIEFIPEVKSLAQGEQKIVEEFLNTLVDTLGSLEHQAVDVSSMTKVSLQHHHNTNETVSSNIKSLWVNAGHASDFVQLKGLLNEHMEVIVNHLRENREREFNQLQATESHLENLTRRIKDLELETQQLHSQVHLEHNFATRDALTSLPNRAAYEERIVVDTARWKRFGHPLSLLVWDVDLFKSINDRFGHQAGDHVLVMIAQELVSSIRSTDFVARYGGEEFVMLLPGANVEQALLVANKIRNKVEKRGFHARGNPVSITISCGISQFVEGDAQDVVFDRADRALYQAKERGRNCCQVLLKPETNLDQ